MRRDNFFGTGSESGTLTPQVNEVIVLQLVNSLELAAHVEVVGGVIEVPHSRVLLVTTKDLLGLDSPVAFVSLRFSFCDTMAQPAWRTTDGARAKANVLVGFVNVLNSEDG